MAELNSTVKVVMDILGKLDEIIEDKSEQLDDYQRMPIYERIYRRIISEDTGQFADLRGRTVGIGLGIALIPGEHPPSCQETLLVCMFPVFNRLGETYPNDVLELRINEAKKYIESCPTTKNVIFYGPVWDSVLWKFHKESFADCSSFLKLFLTVYTRLRK